MARTGKIADISPPENVEGVSTGIISILEIRQIFRQVVWEVRKKRHELELKWQAEDEERARNVSLPSNKP